MSLIVFVVLVAACAATGALFQPGEWYVALAKPVGTPPSAVFAPVWTTLYVLIALAGWLLWRAPRSRARSTALGLWGLQLVLNAAWSWLCFGLHELGLALADVSALLVVIIALIAVSRRARPIAVWLLLPYAVWVGYATWLNAGLWHLNR